MNGMNPPMNRRILVIDDNKAIHDDFRKILSPVDPTREALDATEMALFGEPVDTDAGPQVRFEIDSAYQGQEGLLLVTKALEESRPYAMAFVDMRIPPGWDGMKTTEEIWKVDPAIQVVICTAYSAYSWSEISEKIGHDGPMMILKKPFDTADALRLARELTEKWSLNHSAPEKKPTPGAGK